MMHVWLAADDGVCSASSGANLTAGRSHVLTIWTIGHSTRMIDDFIGILLQHHIETLVDVRHFPGSRRLPHFGKATLQATLTAAGIRYEHLVELGGRRPARANSKNIAWRNASFRGYADYMETEAFRGGVARLLKIARTGRTAFMCSEAVWWRCHRAMIADYLKSVGVRVLHILDAKRLQEHPYTPAARLIWGRLSYAHSSRVRKSSRLHESTTMPNTFRVGDHVEWNSEAGRVRGTIKKKVTSAIQFKGYTVHASKDEPQYLIQSDKTDHLAMHKGSALRKIGKRKR